MTPTAAVTLIFSDSRRTDQSPVTVTGVTVVSERPVRTHVFLTKERKRCVETSVMASVLSFVYVDVLDSRGTNS